MQNEFQRIFLIFQDLIQAMLLPSEELNTTQQWSRPRPPAAPPQSCQMNKYQP